MLNQHAPQENHQAASLATGRRQWRDAIRALPAAQLFHFEWHLLRLDDGCRRSRFGCPTSDVTLQAHAAGIARTDSFVLACFESGHVRGAAELRALDASWKTAEIAFSVETAWQERGIGTALMAAAMREAHAHGIERLYLTCHTLNRRMQSIAERFGAVICFEGCECAAEIGVEHEDETAAQ